jgi:hypothetical protein
MRVPVNVQAHSAAPCNAPRRWPFRAWVSARGFCTRHDLRNVGGWQEWQKDGGAVRPISGGSRRLRPYPSQGVEYPEKSRISTGAPVRCRTRFHSAVATCVDREGGENGAACLQDRSGGAVVALERVIRCSTYD